MPNLFMTDLFYCEEKQMYCLNVHGCEAFIVYHLTEKLCLILSLSHISQNYKFNQTSRLDYKKNRKDMQTFGKKQGVKL